MDTFQHFMEFMRPHWSALALLVTWTGIGIVAVRKRLAWRRKKFLTRVNFSLNYVVANQLAMRTLLEEDAVAVWPNEYGVRKVFGAAARASVANPFLILPNPKDQGFINRAVLNALSERFAETYVAASLGLPVCTSTYVFAVTYETYDEMRTFKIRVLLMEEQTLKALFGPEGQAAGLHITNPVYRTRLHTLRVLYDFYVKDCAAEHPALGRVELGVVLPGAAVETFHAGVRPICGLSGSAHV